jgi:hypothetical protein
MKGSLDLAGGPGAGTRVAFAICSPIMMMSTVSGQPKLPESLADLVEARRSDYDAAFSHIEHAVCCDKPPSATIRLHFVRPDGSGEPRFRALARLLTRYITHYCIQAQRRRDLPELERNEMFMQARDLFRPTEKSGQVGELLIYFLLETVLRAPQALKKMPMTTNPMDERKGSDGIHLLWDEADGVLEFIFAESKLWGSFPDALRDAFVSMEKFHDSRTKQHEVTAFTSGFSNLAPELQEKVLSYVEGENASKGRFAQACLIGFDWDEYSCLDDGRRADFIRDFEARYRAWAVAMAGSLNKKLKAFKHKHLRFEFFMLPFKDIEAFRSWFHEELTGKR